MVDLYLILFDTIRTNPEVVGHGPEGYYFAENFEYSGIELARATSEALVALGVGTSSEPSPFTEAELDTFFGVRVFGSQLDESTLLTTRYFAANLALPCH